MGSFPGGFPLNDPLSGLNLSSPKKEVAKLFAFKKETENIPSQQSSWYMQHRRVRLKGSEIMPFTLFTLFISRKPLPHLLGTAARSLVCSWADLYNFHPQRETVWTAKWIFFVSPPLWGRLLNSLDFWTERRWLVMLGTIQSVLPVYLFYIVSLKINI